jgi:nicotinate-nucleotide adenylyltransferase
MADLKKIGIYGGTFNPLHHAHLILAEWAIIELHLDLVYFIPAFIHAFKNNSQSVSAEIRYEMINAAVKDFPHLKVSRIEIDRFSTSFTVDTLRDLKSDKLFRNTELFYLLGSDNLSEFHLWKNPEEILKLSAVAVFRRSNDNDLLIDNKYKDRIIMLDSPIINISATEIRKRIKENKPYQSLVPEAVYKIIEDKRLYKE